MSRKYEGFPTTDVEIRIAWPSGGSFSEPTARLEINDQRSRRVILAVDLNPAQFTSLMAGRAAEVEAAILSPQHYEKVGKWFDVLVLGQKEADAGEIPEEFVKYRDPHKWSHKDQRSKPSGAMVLWGAEEMARRGYTEFTWYDHNWGWGIRFGRYVDEQPERPW